MANKTEPLPGIENENVIPELTEAAESYADARDDRMAHGRVEKERKTALITLMHKHGLTKYQDTDRDLPVIVELIAEEKVKVRIKDEDEDSDD